MTWKYIAFDIEILRPIPDGARDWKSYRPLGITCAGTLTSDQELNIWHGEDPDGTIAEQMSVDELGAMIDYLEQGVADGYTLLTWNGLGFDFDILAEESGALDTCRALALDHVDMMFHIFCVKGYGLALDTAAKGMGLPGKPPGMRGDLAPKFWAEGRRDEVLDYVAQDVRTTLGLAQQVDIEGRLHWVARSGRDQFLRMNRGWLTVREAMQLPLPDTSWMRDPWSRSKFTGWLGAS
jgi:hypothetical protein